MTLENQVCSLELAKRLKELDVEQFSLFSHYRLSDSPDGTQHWEILMPSRYGSAFEERYSAFTVAELGEMLPASFDWTGTNVFVEFGKSSIHGDYLINLRECARPERMTIHIRADTEADARAKMLIYLLENKLITI